MDKKSLRTQVETKISAALADFSKDVSEKKFKKHIKKAAKILSDGLTISTPKKAAPAPAVKKVKEAATPAPVAKKAKAAPKKTAKAAKKAPAKSKDEA